MSPKKSSSMDSRVRARRVLHSCWTAIAAVIASASTAVAQPMPPTAPSSDPPDAITLDAALARAVEHGPDVDATRAAVDASVAGVRIAQRPTPWELSVAVENFAGHAEAKGFSVAEETVEVGRLFERGDKRNLRQAEAEAAVAVARVDSDAVLADRVRRVAELYLVAWERQEAVTYLEDGEQFARALAGTAARRASVGRSSSAEADLARAAAARAAFDVETARNESAASAAALGAALALAPLVGRLSAPHVGGALRLPTDAIVERATAERLQAERSLALARAEGVTDWRVGAGVRRLNEFGSEVALVSFSAPLGTASRARPAIDAAAARRNRAVALEAVAKRDVDVARSQIELEIRSRTEEVRVLETDILPSLEAALATYRRGYDVGRFSLVEVGGAQRERDDTRRRLVAAHAALARAQLERRLLGGDSAGAGEK